MNAAEQAANLRAQADSLEALADLEQKAESATKSYRKTRSEKNKAAYRSAVEALREARAKTRPADTTVTTGEEA
jgi:hypothetical protein